MTIHYAWPQYRQPWDLGLDIVSFDGDSTPEIDASRRLVSADAESWNTLEVSFTLRTTEKTPAGVGELTAYVLISSARSNTRVPVPLHPDRSDFVGTAKLARSTLAGTVDVTGHIVGRGDTVRAIGTSEPWSIIVDPGEAPLKPGAPPFQTIPVSFSSDQTPAQVRAASNSYAAMDLSGPKPILYLNKDVVGLISSLYAERPKLEKRRVRDFLGSHIAHYALSSLFREALAQTEYDEEVTLPSDPLLSQVIHAVAGAVQSVEDAEEMVVRINGAPSDRAPLWIEIDDALASLTNLGEVVAANLQEVHYG
jgi:hypothetical protein